MSSSHDLGLQDDHNMDPGVVVAETLLPFWCGPYFAAVQGCRGADAAFCRRTCVPGRGPHGHNARHGEPWTRLTGYRSCTPDCLGRRDLNLYFTGYMSCTREAGPAPNAICEQLTVGPVPFVCVWVCVSLSRLHRPSQVVGGFNLRHASEKTRYPEPVSTIVGAAPVVLLQFQGFLPPLRHTPSHCALKVRTQSLSSCSCCFHHCLLPATVADLLCFLVDEDGIGHSRF